MIECFSEHPLRVEFEKYLGVAQMQRSTERQVDKLCAAIREAVRQKQKQTPRWGDMPLDLAQKIRLFVAADKKGVKGVFTTTTSSSFICENVAILPL